MLVIGIPSRLTCCINSNTRWWWIRSPKQQRHEDHTPTRITANSQSAINEVPSPGEQCSTTTRDLLLSIDNRGDNGRIDDTRHSGLWMDRRLRQLDEIQWGMFPFWPEAYVSLGTVMLRFPPYWFGSTAIMTTTTFVITARGMTHSIQHQHAIIHLIASILCFIVLRSHHYDFYDSHDPHIFLSFSHAAWSESRLTFIFTGGRGGVTQQANWEFFESF